MFPPPTSFDTRVLGLTSHLKDAPRGFAPWAIPPLLACSLSRWRGASIYVFRETRSIVPVLMLIGIVGAFEHNFTFIVQHHASVHHKVLRQPVGDFLSQRDVHLLRCLKQIYHVYYRVPTSWFLVFSLHLSIIRLSTSVVPFLSAHIIAKLGQLAGPSRQ